MPRPAGAPIPGQFRNARGIPDDRTLCDRLLAETGVAMLPGQEFGRRPEELTARIALVCFDGIWALAAAEVLPTESVSNGPV